MPLSKRLLRILRLPHTGAFTVTLALGACTHSTSIPQDLNQVLSLREGESVRVSGSVAVHAASLQDSRCPSDVVCITAGDVVIVLDFSEGGTTRTDTLRLKMPPRSTTYGGMRFQPTDVSPYPDTRVGASKKTVTLRVTAAP